MRTPRNAWAFYHFSTWAAPEHHLGGLKSPVTQATHPGPSHQNFWRWDPGTEINLLSSPAVPLCSPYESNRQGTLVKRSSGSAGVGEPENLHF